MDKCPASFVFSFRESLDVVHVFPVAPPSESCKCPLFVLLDGFQHLLHTPVTCHKKCQFLGNNCSMSICY